MYKDYMPTPLPNQSQNNVSSKTSSSLQQKCGFWCWESRLIRSAFNSLTHIQKIVVAIFLVTIIGGGAWFVRRLIVPAAAVTVIGSGTVEFEPQKATVIVTYANSGTSPVQTIETGEQKTQTLINTAKNIVGEAEVQKSFYQVVPTQPSRVEGTIVTGYQVANAFSIEFNQVDKTDELVKTLYELGATTVSNVTFSVDDESKVEQEARKKAVENAKKQAQELARASGKRLGRIVTITDDQRSAASSVEKQTTNQNTSNSMSMTKRVSVLFEMR